MGARAWSTVAVQRHLWIEVERAGFCLLALLLFAAAGCRSPGGPPAVAPGGPRPAEPVAAADPGATAALAAAASTYWNARLEANPLEATALGQ